MNNNHIAIGEMRGSILRSTGPTGAGTSCPVDHRLSRSRVHTRLNSSQHGIRGRGAPTGAGTSCPVDHRLSGSRAHTKLNSSQHGIRGRGGLRCACASCHMDICFTGSSVHPRLASNQRGIRNRRNLSCVGTSCHGLARTSILSCVSNSYHGLARRSSQNCVVTSYHCSARRSSMSCISTSCRGSARRSSLSVLDASCDSFANRNIICHSTSTASVQLATTQQAAVSVPPATRVLPATSQPPASIQPPAASVPPPTSQPPATNVPPPASPGYLWYFTFGANLNKAVLKRRMISPKVTLPALVRDRQLEFCHSGGYATLEPVSGAVTHGALLYITTDEMTRLVQSESWYEVQNLEVQSYCGQMYTAKVFITREWQKVQQRGLPPTYKYYCKIVDGAEEVGLDAKYRAELKAMDHLPAGASLGPEYFDTLNSRVVKVVFSVLITAALALSLER